MTANDGLPPGWEMSTDPSTGRPFYINHNTMQTSWTPPVETPLPAGWEQQRDAEGRIYFVNTVSGESQWEDPRLTFEPTVSSSSPSSSSPSTAYPSIETNYPSSSLSSSTSTNEWSCPACTYANPNSESTCTMCGTSRGGYGESTASTRGNSVGKSNSGYGRGDEIDAATAAAIAAAQAEDEAYFDNATSEEQRRVTDPRDLTPHMVPDEHSTICTLCAKTFDWKNRRHHCKCCGSLLCGDCSSRKVKFSIPGLKEMERRVCDLCYDHQCAGDKHCYLRYIGILRDAGSSRSDDHMLALQGIADMIDKLPDALQETASLDQQASAMRTLDVVQRCGGASTLCELLNPNAPPDVQIQSCRIIASVAAVAANSPSDSQAALSRSSVSNELSQGSFAMKSIATMLARQSTPWQAHMHLAHAMYLLGDMFEIQEASRTMRILPALCDALLASQEELQSWATMAVARLIAENANNVDEMLDANGMQALVLLLSSPNISIKEHAANAICSGLELEDREPHGLGGQLASRVRDAMVQLGGATTAVSLLQSESPTIARSGLRLITYLSNGQAEVVRAAGAVPLVVALLASRDQGCQASAAQVLRNVASCSYAGSQDVLESGGLSMCVSLLNAPDSRTRANAAALCEAFASDEKGSSIILESGAVPALVSLVRHPENELRGPAAGALVRLMQVGAHTKQAVVNAGGVEALLGLENSTDPFVLRQLIGAVYSFVSDEALLQSLTRRIPPHTMAMKLLQMLGNRSNIALDSGTMEMLLLVVAVLCGARDGDQYDEPEVIPEHPTPEQQMQKSQEQQTRDLVASNGSPLVIPLLGDASHQPALVLAAFRLLLSVCKSPVGAQGVAKAGGIPAVVRALDDSLHLEGNSHESYQLVYHLRLYGLTLFGKLCGGNSGGNTISNATVDDIRFGVRAISRVLDQPLNSASPEEKVAVQLAAVRAIRNLSVHSGNWESIVSIALPQLLEILLADDSNPELLQDIALIISNLAKLEKHCDTVLDAGAVFALLGLLSEKEGDAVAAGLSTLRALAESSKRCRLAIVEQGGSPKLLHIAEQRPPPLSFNALQCLVALSEEPANGPKITAETGATDVLLRLMKSSESTVAELALKVLLAVAKDSETIWEQLVVNADIDSSIALLQLGPPRVQAHAVSTIAALCGDSPGYALCASPKILEVLPTIVKLLSPPEHFGADKSESPAKEAAAACGLLAAAPAARNGLLQADVIPALVNLLLRERRLGRPRSATSEHTLQALFAFSTKEVSPEGHVPLPDDAPVIGMWDRIQHLNKRRDTIDTIITILDAHIRDTSPTPSGCDRLELCESAIVLLGRLPLTLSPNEASLLGRSARSINLIMSESVPEHLMKACLETLGRIAKEPSVSQMLIAAGTIRSVSLILEPLTQDAEDVKGQLETGVILNAAGLISALVTGANDRSVDDAVIGTKAIPALATLITRTSDLFTAEEHQSKALSAGLEAIASLSRGGVSIQKAIMASGSNVLPALAEVASLFDQDTASEPSLNVERASHAMMTLSRLATLDEHRVQIVSDEHGIPAVCFRILDGADSGRAKESKAYLSLVQATVQLVSDLGPCVASTHTDLAMPLISRILGESTFCSAWLPALQTLENVFLDSDAAASIVKEEKKLLSVVDGLLAKTATASMEFPIKSAHLQSASAILASLALVPEVTEQEDLLDACIKACSSVLLAKDVTSHEVSVVVSNALLALRQLLISDSARSKMRGMVQLLRVLKTIGTSPDTEMFASHLASRILAALGTGEKIVKQPRKAPVHAPPPPAPPQSSPGLKPSQPQPSQQVKPPPQSQNVTSTAPSSHSRTSSASSSSLPPASPLLGPSAVASGSPPMKPYAAPPPAAKRSLLPTFSGAVPGGLRSSGSSLPSASDERASYELAMKLQEEENRRSSSKSNPPAPPRMSSVGSTSSLPQSNVWSCPTCTYENPMSNATCEMCENARPSSAALSSGTVNVRCPGCRTVLSTQGNAHSFRCMTCGTVSNVASNRA